MKSITSLAFAAVLSILLPGCTESFLTFPVAIFDGPFPKKNIDLAEVLGNEFTVVTSSGDTVGYEVISDQETNIIRSHSGDTLFAGTVCRYRGLYLLSMPVNNGYSIVALRKKGKLLYGLSDSYLQQFAVDSLTAQPPFDKLVLERSEDYLRLHADKAGTGKLFKEVMLLTRADTLLGETHEELLALAADPAQSPLAEEFEYTTSLYPNPVSDMLHVKFNSVPAANWSVRNEAGKIMLKGTVNESYLTLIVNNLPIGTYYFSLTGETGEKEIIRFLKEK